MGTTRCHCADGAASVSLFGFLAYTPKSIPLAVCDGFIGGQYHVDAQRVSFGDPMANEPKFRTEKSPKTITGSLKFWGVLGSPFSVYPLKTAPL